MNSRPHHRLTLDIDPKLWEQFKELVPRGFVKLLVEAYMEDFVNVVKAFSPKDRTMMIGLLISRKYSPLSAMIREILKEEGSKDDD